MAHYATSELHKEKLKEFSSKTSVRFSQLTIIKEGKDEYYRYVVKERRTLPEIVWDFGLHKSLPLHLLVELAGRQKPREFSISSSPHLHKDQIHLTMAVIEYKTRNGRAKTGVCSHWLANATDDEPVPMWVKKGTMVLPAKDVPVIMVGPGTGVAAFKGFIEERSLEKGGSETVLVFGCRNKDKDFYFAKEWETLGKTMKLDVIAAFSRDQATKSYVQHKIREEGKKLAGLILEKGARIYVSGKSKNMPKSVEKAFKDILAAEIGEENAVAKVEEMRKKGLYIQEVW